MRPDHEPPKWPLWVIAGVGLMVTVAGLIWAGTLYDSRGARVIDANMALVLVAILGPGGTAGLMFAQRSLGAIKHQVHNNNGGSLKDTADRSEHKIDAMEKQLVSIGQSLARLVSVPAEIGGLRRELGHVADNQGQLRKDFSDHVQWALGQEDRIDGLEDTVDPRKKD